MRAQPSAQPRRRMWGDELRRGAALECVLNYPPSHTLENEGRLTRGFRFVRRGGRGGDGGTATGHGVETDHGDVTGRSMATLAT